MKARLIRLLNWLTRKKARDARELQEREEKALLFAYLEQLTSLMELQIKSGPVVDEYKADRQIREGRKAIFRYSSAIRGFSEYDAKTGE